MSTAAHQPEVYCGLVKNCLTDILACSSSDLEKNVQEFAVLIKFFLVKIPLLSLFFLFLGVSIATSMSQPAHLLLCTGHD